MPADAATDPVRPFEWLTNFNSLSRFLSQSKLFPDNDEQVLSPRRALHVGCGTSTLGESLVERLGYGEVVNADRDAEALVAMEGRWNDRLAKGGEGTTKNRKHGEMKWLHIDFSAVRSSTTRPTDPGASSRYQPGYFDLVVDKSTLDCALCSDDAAAGLILASHSALRPDGGVYFVISFHHVDFVLPLLRDCPGTDWDVEHAVVKREVDLPEHLVDRYKAGESVNEEPSSSEAYIENERNERPESAWSSGSFVPTAEYGRTANVFICRRRGEASTRGSCCGLNFDDVMDHVHSTNDDWFKTNNPMVTHTREVDLRLTFAKLLDLQSQGGGGRDESLVVKRLPLEECYGALFTDAEREHLTYEYFLEDWHAFLQERRRRGSNFEVPEDGMAIDTALLFLNEMQ